MTTLSGLCVFCGSSRGADTQYADAARRFGRILADAHVPLVFGGGSLGLMGEVAASVMGAKGQVVGIIPEFLRHVEPPLGAISELIVTQTMHERKALMFERSDGFVVLPGGIGTLEETVEMITWAQLGLHAKPIVIVNIDGYWNPLLALLESIIERQFARPGLRRLYRAVSTVDEVLPAVHAHLSAAA